MISQEIKKILSEEMAKISGKKLAANDIILEFPENERFGDYSTNCAMRFWHNFGFKDPQEFAQILVNNLQKDKDLAKIVSKIEVAGPGFINFWLDEKFFVRQLTKIIKQGDKFGKSGFLKGKRFLIEHTSPNIIKTLHVGHVRNNALGMFLGRLFAFLKAKVKLDCINNDRGIHIMKAVWAYQKYGRGRTPQSEKIKPDHFVDQFYVQGAKEEQNPGVKQEMQELLRKWEAGDKETRMVWEKLTAWVYQGFSETYKRLGSHHDKNWYESEFYQKGRKTVLQGVKKGIFKKLPDNAILSNLEKYNLPDTILLRADGTTMYHTQDLWLTKLKRKYLPRARYFWVVGPEQVLYLKQLYAMCEQIGIGKTRDYEHIAYGYIFLKGKGKMSSRQGTVVSADELLDMAVGGAREIMNTAGIVKDFSEQEKERIAKIVGIGAVKYAMLKHARLSDIQFDLEETVGLEGDSGPYIQYTYARCQSVLRKKTAIQPLQNYEANDEEIAILRWLTRFPEVLMKSAEQLSSNLVCNYLFTLCQRFNLFYQKHRVLGQPEEKFRLLLIAATAQVIKNGLWLLGIESPERM